MKSKSLTIMVIFLAIFIAVMSLPGIVWGGDGTLLWFPIISEYLQGYETYQNSLIFSEQNLLAIYGELPFWNLFKIFGLSGHGALNFTFLVWIFLGYGLLFEILKGLKKEVTLADSVVLLLYTCLCPIVFNRVYAGHFNLLFGMMPFLVCLSLIFNQSKRVLVVSFFSLWCAFSIQSYQILIYHVFYLPFVLCFFNEYAEVSRKKYFLSLLAVTFVSFAFSWKGFSAMFTHAMSGDTARSLNSSIVYSYTVTQLIDIFNLILAIPNNLTLMRGPGFYHELNYPLIPWLIYCLIKLKGKTIQWVTGLTLLFLFLFSMGAFPFHFLGELPLIKSFRVPQRSFMPLCFLLPIWGWGISKLDFQKKETLCLLGVMVFGFLIPYFEIFILFVLLTYRLWRSKVRFLPSFDNRVALGLLMGTAILIGPFKVDHIVKSNQEYAKAIVAVKSLKKSFTPKEARDYTFHFFTRSPMLITSAANTLGFRTYEGYGHPPKKYLDKLSALTGTPYRPLTNQLIFPFEKGSKDKVLKGFSVDYMVQFNANNTLLVKRLKKGIK